MEKTLLLAGKELPDGGNFASGAVTCGRRTLVTKSHAAESAPAPTGTAAAVWNRPSALSARSLVLRALNEFGRLDECVIIFDESNFAARFGNLENSAENVRVIEELISSYQYLTMEVVARLQKRAADAEKRPLRLVYLHKSNPSLAETVLARLQVRPSSPFLSTAAAAFRAYAENVAAGFVDSADVLPLLVQCDGENSLAANDNALAVWLFGYIATLDSLRKPLSAKQKLAWVKAGTKSPGGFGFFG